MYFLEQSKYLRICNYKKLIKKKTKKTLIINGEKMKSIKESFFIYQKHSWKALLLKVTL